MRLAKATYKALPESALVLLHGEIGAGKTTFLRYCLESVVGQDVTSPTFSIMNVYDTNIGGTIVHMDLYRIESYTELYQLGVEDYLGNAKIFIEWPDFFQKAFPGEPATCSIDIRTVQNSSVRQFEILGLELEDEYT